MLGGILFCNRVYKKLDDVLHSSQSSVVSVLQQSYTRTSQTVNCQNSTTVSVAELSISHSHQKKNQRHSCVARVLSVSTAKTLTRLGSAYSHNAAEKEPGQLPNDQNTGLCFKIL